MFDVAPYLACDSLTLYFVQHTRYCCHVTVVIVAGGKEPELKQNPEIVQK